MLPDFAKLCNRMLSSPEAAPNLSRALSPVFFLDDYLDLDFIPIWKYRNSPPFFFVTVSIWSIFPLPLRGLFLFFSYA